MLSVVAHLRARNNGGGSVLSVNNITCSEGQLATLAGRLAMAQMSKYAAEPGFNRKCPGLLPEAAQLLAGRTLTRAGSVDTQWG